MSTPGARRFWGAVTLLAVLLLCVAWFLLLSPQRLHAQRVRVQEAGVVSGNVALREQVLALQQQSRDLTTVQAQEERLRQLAPTDPQLPELLTALTQAASVASVELVSVVPEPPQPLTLPATPSPASATPAPSPAGPPAVAGGLQQIPLTVVVRGGYLEAAAFLDQVETLPRAILVLAVSVGAEPAGAGRPPGEGGRIELRLTGRAFVLLTTPVPSGAAPSTVLPSSAPPSSTPSSTAPSSAPLDSVPASSTGPASPDGEQLETLPTESLPASAPVVESTRSIPEPPPTPTPLKSPSG